MAFGIGDAGIDYTAAMNPQWARWLDTVKAATGGKRLRFAPQPNIEGSNQFRGSSVQPSLLALEQLVTPQASTPYDDLSTDDLIAQSRASRRKRRI